MTKEDHLKGRVLQFQGKQVRRALSQQVLVQWDSGAARCIQRQP